MLHITSKVAPAPGPEGLGCDSIWASGSGFPQINISGDYTSAGVKVIYRG